MFSSLEALDAEDTLNALPTVARHGAFQPKAKPRARKGAPLPAKRASTSSMEAPPKAVVVSSSTPDNAINQSAEKLSKAAAVIQVGGRIEVETGGEAGLHPNKFLSVVSSELPGKVGLETQPFKDADVTVALFRGYSPTHNARDAHDHDAVKVAMEATETITLLEENGQLQGVYETPQCGAQRETVLNTQDASLAGDEEQPLCQPTQVSKGMEPASLDQLTGELWLQHESGVLLPSMTHNFQSHASEPVELMQYLSRIYDADNREVLLSTLGSSNQDAAQEMVISLEEFIPSHTVEYALGREGAHVTYRDDYENLENMVAQESFQQTALVDPLLDTSIEKLMKVKDMTEMKGGRAKKGKGLSPSSVDGNQPKVRSKPQKTKAATFAAAAASKSAAAGIVKASGAEEIIEEGVMAEGPGKKKRTAQATELNKVGSRLRKIEAKPKEAMRKIEAKPKAAMLAAIPTEGGTQPLDKEVADEVDGAQENIGEVALGKTEGERNRKKRMHTEAREQKAKGGVMLLDMATSCSQLKNGGSPAVSTGDARKRKRTVPARYADTMASLVLQTGTELEDDTIPMGGNTLEPVKKEKRGQAPESEKLKVANLSLASGAIASKLSVELLDANGAVEPVQFVDKGVKKKFKKFIERRKRVERLALVNPADPDFDPKKMTMMDIIRLAEAKDRMLRKGNAKNSKNRKEAESSNAPEQCDNPETTCMAPQVQIIDGRLVINQESLTVQAHPKDDVRTYKRVEETHSKLNYHSYMKKTPKQTWRKDETELFYQALREFGTNFAMIQHLFPGRTRKQVFLKFKKEEKCCPLRIAEALRLRPCEYSHHIEILSSMNLLTSETPDSPQDFSPYETALSREEEEDVACSIADVDRLMAAKGSKGNGGISKAEEWQTQTNILEDRGGDCQANEGGDNKEGERQEPPPKTEETAKPPCESPKKPPSPPRKRSLFSYQWSTAKS